MNTRPVLDPYKQPLALAASFNTDNSFFSVALDSGFRVFRSLTCEAKISRDLSGGIGCADMVGKTNYIILAGGGREPHFPPNKIHIWNDQAQVVAGSLELMATVLRIRASRHFIVVAQPFNVGLYELQNPPRKMTHYDTVKNIYGLCAFENNIVAMPGMNPGQVRIVKIVDSHTTPLVSLIPAHTAPLRAIALNKNGDMVATASEKGTIIRLWLYPSGTKLAEFRRGVDEAAIFSMAFSPDNSMLAVTSDKSTVHIFDIPNPNSLKTAANDPKTHKYGFLSRFPLLPRQFSDTYSVASTHFEMGDELGGWSPRSQAATSEAIMKWSPERIPTKGLLGWLDNGTLLVIGAGQDARWEKFIVGVDDAGRRVIYREAWKKYLD